MAKSKRKKKVLLLLVPAIFLAANLVVVMNLGRLLNTTRRPPPYASTERASATHARLLIADMHADSLLWKRDLLARGSWGHVDVPRLVEGHVALQGFSVVTENATLLAVVDAWPLRTWSSMTERALYQAEQLSAAAAASGGRLTLIGSRAELEAYLARRNSDASITAGLLSVEGAQALDGDTGNLERLYAAGFRMVGLAHFSDNEYAGSSSGTRKGGLTARGRELVERLEERRVLIDLAHASPQTIDDVLKIATRPVFVSHTGVQGTCRNERNLSDDELRGVARNGGIVGIGYWEKATCGTDVGAIADAIRYAVNVAGVDHVGLGSDYDGGSAMPFDTSGLVLLTQALLERNFTDEEIGKIMGGNVIRLMREQLP
ncbi:MAG: dipeptidase [Pyrinomonadaceae bacterium]